MVGMWAAVCLMLAVALFGCAPDSQRAVNSIESAGYTRVRLGGYPFYACSDDDNFNVEFSAINANGHEVHGALCCGFLKNCTIRLD